MFVNNLDSTNDGRFGAHLEMLFGIPPNNRNESDLPGVELKTSVSKSSPVTLFSKEPSFKQYSTLELIHKYGQNGKFNATIKYDHIWNNLHITIANDCLEIYDQNDDMVVCSWSREVLEEKIDKKIQKIDLFIVQNHGDSFGYSNKHTFEGTNYNKFLSAIKKGHLSIDFRMKIGKNRGTAFRLRKNHMTELYADTKSMELSDSFSQFLVDS